MPPPIRTGPANVAGSCRSWTTAAEDQRDDEQDQQDEEQGARDVGRGGRDAAETKYSGDGLEFDWKTSGSGCRPLPLVRTA